MLCLRVQHLGGIEKLLSLIVQYVKWCVVESQLSIQYPYWVRTAALRWGGWRRACWGKFGENWKLKITFVLNVCDGDGGTLSTNIGKEVHNKISFEYVEFFIYLQNTGIAQRLLEMWVCSS